MKGALLPGLAGVMVLLQSAGYSRAESAVTTAPESRPNIVFILADDLGWSDAGCYGSSFHDTPHIDRLAQRGMRFTQAYAGNPLCSPTRASILTGQYPSRIGLTGPHGHLPEVILRSHVDSKGRPDSKCVRVISATRLNTDYVTLAEILKDAGYTTGHFGKWHLGPEPYSPLQHGFDVDVPHWAGAGPAGVYVAPWKSPQFKLPAQAGQHLEDLMAQEAKAFIRANKHRPFFLNYWAFSVHGPYDSKKNLIQRYRAKLAGLPSDSQRNALYAAMVQCLDDAVGTLVAAIEEAGIAERTIIIFFSDNGGVHWADSKVKAEFQNIPITSNAPLRGGKGSIYEGGTREPLIVVWPGVTPARSTSDAIVHSTDFLPTLLDILKLPAPAGQVCDGKSFVPALQSRPHDRGPIFCHFPHFLPLQGGVEPTLPSTYVRAGDWKLIRFYCENSDGTHRHELYNLKSDIGERQDLVDQMPSKVEDMSVLIDQFLKETGSVVPKPNPAYGRPSRGEGKHPVRELKTNHSNPA